MRKLLPLHEAEALDAPGCVGRDDPILLTRSLPSRTASGRAGGTSAWMGQGTRVAVHALPARDINAEGQVEKGAVASYSV